MDLFDEVSKAKQEFPKKKTIAEGVSSLQFNFYQIFALGLFLLFFFLGIFLGNLFATCQATSYFYSKACLVTEFNFSLMIAIWFVGLILCVFFYSIGHIIELLTNISDKLSKFRL